MKKLLGVMVTTIAFTCMLVAKINIVVVMTSTTVFAYNFFLGHNRGHVLHMMLLCWLCILSIVVVLYDNELLSYTSTTYLFLILCLIFVSCISVSWRSIVLFYKDYVDGIKRDYFFDPPRIQRFR